MSTKTMRPPPRRVLTASTSSSGSSFVNPTPIINNINININISNKRKERGDGDGFPIDSSINLKSSNMVAAATDTTSGIGFFKHIASNPGRNKGPDSGQSLSDNKSNQLLLAGYMAQEFLSRGTLLGQAWDPTRSEPNHCDLNASVSSERRCAKKLGYSAGEEDKQKPWKAPVEQQQGKELEEEEGRRRYKEVANLLMTGGANFPGIVNPSQLGRLLQL